MKSAAFSVLISDGLPPQLVTAGAAIAPSFPASPDSDFAARSDSPPSEPGNLLGYFARRRLGRGIRIPDRLSP
jgi:hypothetical protein